MKRLIFLLSLLISTPVFAGTISFDQAAVSADLTVSKYNTDLDKIYREFNTNTQSSNIAADTVAESDMADDANPRLRTYEGAACEKVYSGLVPQTAGSLSTTITAGTAYPLGYRVVKSSSTAKTFTASKWTFVDIDINGDFQYSEVAIGAATPSVATNSIRLARVSTDGTTVNSVSDLRTTSCTTGAFSDINSGSGETTSLDDILKAGAPVRESSNAGRTPNGFAQGAQVSWDTHTTFKVTAGALYINGKYRANSTDITVSQTADAPTTGVSGIDTGSTSDSTTYYVYGVADQDAVDTFSASYSTNSSTPSGITNYRLIGKINTTTGAAFTSRDIAVAHGFTEREIPFGWINFDGSGTAAILDSFNVSSLTDNAQGDFTVTWDIDPVSANYAVAAIATRDTGQSTNEAVVVGIESIASTAIGIHICQHDGCGAGDRDPDVVTLIAIGDSRK